MNLDSLVMPSSSCSIEINEGMRAGVRVKLDWQNVEVEIKDGNSDTQYKHCNR